MKALVTAIASLLVAAAAAAQPHLIKDLNPSYTASSSQPSLMATIGTTSFFAAYDATQRGLWKTDGTTAGTVVFEAPTDWKSFLESDSHGGVINGRLLCDGMRYSGLIYDESGLYATDGTSAGTELLVTGGPFGIRRMIDHGGYAYLELADYYGGIEHWRTDGTAAGTAPIALPASVRLVAFGGSLYYLASDGLYRTDGTNAGTRISTTAGSNLAATSNRLIFVKPGYSNPGELWTSDGTTAQVVRSFTEINQLAAISGDKVIFRATDAGSIATWVSDGTLAGTLRLADGWPASVWTAGGKTFLATHSPYRLYVTDGTVAGTVVLEEFAGYETAVDARDVNGTLVFIARTPAAGMELWRSDGTPAGTDLLRDIVPGYDGGLRTQFAGVKHGGIFYFGANDGGLWRTDGSVNGTYLVAAGVVPFVEYPEGMFLDRPDGFLFTGTSVAEGKEVWFSDGTQAGTRILMNVAPERNNDSNPWSFGVTSNGVTFSASDGAVTKLYRTNGTAGGTSIISSSYPMGDELSVNGLHYFATYTTSGPALWRSDGTVAGTISLLTMTGPAFDLTPYDGKVVFMGTTNDGGREPWITDGTAGNTYVFRDLTPGSTGTPGRLSVSAQGVFLIGRPTLWRTDGTAAGTFSMTFPDWFIGENAAFTESNGVTWFTPGNELWRTDGTSAGTTKVGTLRCSPSQLWAVGTKLVYPCSDVLFSADTTTGVSVTLASLAACTRHAAATLNGALFYRDYYGQLWRTDGTPANTMRIAAARSTRCEEQQLLAANGRLYFEAYGNGYDYLGIELWSTDGTAAGTAMIADSAPGWASNWPRYLTAAGSTLYFSGFTREAGREPWAYALPPCATPQIKTQPINRFTDKTRPATLSVAAINGDVSYQWYRGTRGDVSTPVGTNASTYDAAIAAMYWVRATNACGSTDSVAVRVDILGGWIARVDLDADSRSDQFIRNVDTNAAGAWRMDGTNVTAGAILGTLPQAWRIGATGDLNADGRTDLLLQNHLTGEVASWIVNGLSITSSSLLIAPGSSFALLGTADLNGDHRADLIVRNLGNGDVTAYLGTATGVSQRATIGTPGFTWMPIGAADLNNDGKDDLLIRNLLNGDLGVWLMNGLVLTHGAVIGTPGLGWRVAGAADLNGDTKPDIILQNLTNGDVGGWLLNGLVVTGGAVFGQPGTGWQAVNVADFDRDGRADLILQETATGNIGAWMMNGLTITSGIRYGTPGPAWMAVGAR
jgi:ELWxxDGT repeat protein